MRIHTTAQSHSACSAVSRTVHNYDSMACIPQCQIRIMLSLDLYASVTSTWCQALVISNVQRQPVNIARWQPGSRMHWVPRSHTDQSGAPLCAQERQHLPGAFYAEGSPAKLFELQWGVTRAGPDPRSKTLTAAHQILHEFQRFSAPQPGRDVVNVRSDQIRLHLFQPHPGPDDQADQMFDPQWMGSSSCKHAMWRVGFASCRCCRGLTRSPCPDDIRTGLSLSLLPIACCWTAATEQPKGGQPS